MHTHDHELKIGSTTKQLDLVRDDTGRAMYEVTEDIPRYQSPLKFEQTDWQGGHGRYVYSIPNAYYSGSSIDTTQEGCVFLGPLITEVKESDDTTLDSAPVGFFWAVTAGKWLCWTAGKVYIYGTKWTAATTTLAGVTGMAEFNGIIYAGMGASTKYYYSSDGDTWTITDLTDGYANGFLISPNPAGTAENLWKYKTPNQISRTTDGRTVAAGGVQWESPTYIGDTTANITKIFLIADKLYVGKTDSLFSVDSDGGVHNEMPGELKINHSTDNFKYLANWQTSAYFSLQRGGGELSTANTFRPVSPLTDIGDVGKIGDTVGISSDRDFLYWAVDEGTNTYIYKGREIIIDNKLHWSWCPWISLLTTTCATIKVCQHSTTDRRLWLGYGTHTAYVILSENPLADSAARYAPLGSLRMSYFYGTDTNFDKMFQSAVIEQHCVSSGAITTAQEGETVTMSYLKDTTTSAAIQINEYNTAGVVETNFDTAVSCKRISFNIILQSNTSTNTPVVTYFQAKGIEKPTTVRVHEAYYRIGDTPSKRAETIRAFLRGGRTSTTLIKFADLRYGEKTVGTASGDYVWCVMEPGFPKEIEIKHDKQKQPELAIMVRLREVSYTIS